MVVRGVYGQDGGLYESELMAKLSDAQALTRALEGITVKELLELSEDDTVRLALAFEAFVDKIQEVVAKAAQEHRTMVN